MQSSPASLALVVVLLLAPAAFPGGYAVAPPPQGVLLPDAAARALLVTDWSRTLDLSRRDAFGGLDIGPDGGIVAVGGTGGYVEPTLVAKYDAQGGLVWSRVATLTEGYVLANNVALGDNGDVFLAGSRVLAGGSWSPFAAKLDSSGALVWSRVYPVPGDSFALDADVDTAGNLLLAGFRRAPSFPDQTGFVLRLDPQGEMLLDLRYDAPAYESDHGYGVAAVEGGFILVGQSISTAGGGWKSRGFAAKYDFAGNQVWTRIVDDTRNGALRGIAADAFGTSVAGNVFNGADPDLLVGRLDPDGKVVWTTTVAGTGSHLTRGVAVDALGDTFVSGENRNGNRWLPQLAKVGGTGQPLWLLEFPGDAWFDVATDGLGNPVLAGATGPDEDLDALVRAHQDLSPDVPGFVPCRVTATPIAFGCTL